ncbi:MAG TPA: TQO small subunit DoxD [Ktedonobacteraceae bacterium]
MRPVQSPQHAYTRPSTRAPNPPTTPTTKQMQFPGWVFLPLRLFLGITFVYAGIQKLTDPQFFRSSTPGYIGNQIIAFAHNSPIRGLLIHVALPHAALFGLLIAFGEIAIGLGTLVGLLFRPAAFFGLLLSLTFFLSASWHVYPYFYGADIVFVFAWLTLLLHGPSDTGLPVADIWLAKTLFPEDTASSSNTITTIGRAALIGNPGIAPTEPQEPDESRQPTVSLKPPARGNRYRTVIHRKTQNRRSFLLGVLTGGAGVVALGIISLLLQGPGQNEGSGSPTTTTTSGPAPTTSASSSTTGGAIAQASSLPKNSATTFTIPSSGDPGVLIHLPNDQFVAYDATCTHAGCPVDYDPNSQQLICPCHGATYDPAHSAAVLNGPAQTPLMQVAIHVDGTTGAITLQS